MRQETDPIRNSDTDDLTNFRWLSNKIASSY